MDALSDSINIRCEAIGLRLAALRGAIAAIGKIAEDRGYSKISAVLNKAY